MKSLLVVGLLFFTSLAQAHLYKGSGKWNNWADLEGDYEAFTLVSPDEYFSNYKDKFGDKNRHWLIRGEKENFVITNQMHQSIGAGFCKDDQCTFQWEEGDSQYIETWTFEDDKLKRSGQRLRGDRWVLWSDELDKVTAPN